MTASKDKWILLGYEIFALQGHTSLKVESLSKCIGVNKSSFYHYFGNLEIFIEALLEYHIQQSILMANKERQVQHIDPELIQILVDHKIDLLFNRQLRIHQSNKAYYQILMQSNKIIGEVYVLLWVKELDLKLSKRQIEGLFELALENFYLQINFENLNKEWISTYFSNLKRIAGSFTVNGSV